MKHKFLLSAMFLLIIVGLYIPDSYSQYPTYTMTLANDAQTAANVYEFDVFLLRTGSTQFELFGVQMGFTFNNAVKNGGTMTVSYVPGTTDSVIVTTGQQNISFNQEVPGCIKIPAATPMGGAGTGAIISNVPPGTRVGRLSLTNSVNFDALTFDIKYCFTTTPYPTKVVAYVGVVATNITDSTQHFNNLANHTLPVEAEITLPRNFDLSQNYPNPFNPSTNINYTLPFDSKVTLEVYDITGERIGQLVNDEQSAGYYSVNFNSSSLNKIISSGVYFYRIIAVDKATGNYFSSVKKMILMK